MKVKILFLVVLVLGCVGYYFSSNELADIVNNNERQLELISDDEQQTNSIARLPVQPISGALSNRNAGVSAQKSDFSHVESDILSDDDRKVALERLASLENSVKVHILDYDENLSDLDKRKEIEARFSEQTAEIKHVALQLAKDQLAQDKLRESR